MATWFCCECFKNIGDKEYCPYCGTHRLGDMAMNEDEAKAVLERFFRKRSKKIKQPMFSVEEQFLYGIHPDDKLYRKTMELEILSSNYRKRK